MKASFINNPYDILLEVFNENYPGNPCDIQFDDTMPDEPPWGATGFPDDPKENIIVFINANLSIKDGVEILAHELAHVVVRIQIEEVLLIPPLSSR